MKKALIVIAIIGVGAVVYTLYKRSQKGDKLKVGVKKGIFAEKARQAIAQKRQAQA